jgi:hypothetical protein
MGTAAQADKIRVWDSEDVTYSAYRSKGDCFANESTCVKINDNCGGGILIVNKPSSKKLQADFNRGGTLYVKLLTDAGYLVRKLCEINKNF